MLRLGRLSAIALTGLLWLMPAGAGAFDPPALPTPSAPLYVIIPFGEPGDTDVVLEHDTQHLSQALSDHHVRSALGVPTDAVEAVSNARSICTQYAAAGLIVNEMRFAQTKGFNAPEFAVGFIPWVGGVIAGQGGLDRTPIHAQYKLFLVDCRTKVEWRTMTQAQKVHHGTNLSAGLTDISYRAIDEAVDAFAARRSQAH